MHAARVEKVRTAMQQHGVDTLVCCGQNNVAYLTGGYVPAADAARAAAWRSVAILDVDAARPRLHTRFPEGAPPIADVEPWLAVELDDGATELARRLGSGVVAVDDLPPALWQALGARDVADGALVLGAAKRTKTADELACIALAQAINEDAIDAVRPLARAGMPATALSGAFIDAVAERGARWNTVDPVFQVVPRALPPGTDEVPFPVPTRAVPLAAGEVVWVDTGINVHGYASDYGATWFVDHAPDAARRDQFERWRAVVDQALTAVRAGNTAGDVVRAAGRDRGRMPWLSYFYLAHGIGTDSAEMPFVGSDLGLEFDDALVLEPGMVLVFEPVIWDDGAAGHRSEEIVVVTTDGYDWLWRRAALDEAGA
jgi:Xaa-Pro aminopeptidase